MIADALTDTFLDSAFVELREGGEVGYLLAPGAGVMAEAVRAVVHWAHEAGIRRLFLTTDPANIASQGWCPEASAPLRAQ